MEWLGDWHEFRKVTQEKYIKKFLEAWREEYLEKWVKEWPED